jgi:DNA-binding LacI/PurR family transcriptional regulator
MGTDSQPGETDNRRYKNVLPRSSDFVSNVWPSGRLTACGGRRGNDSGRVAAKSCEGSPEDTCPVRYHIGNYHPGIHVSTIYDVARRAGVSISTVSLALNSPSRLKRSTLDRVLAAADELAYVPKVEAVTRARRGVGRIGVMAPFTSYPSFGRRLSGILKATRDTSLEIVVYDQESAAVTSPSLSSIPLTRQLDGLIIMALPLDDTVAERLIKHKLPTVLVESEHPRFSSISIDDAEGGRLVAELLLGRGHTRLACIIEQKRGQQRTLPAESRPAAFLRAAQEAGSPLPESRVKYVSYGMEPARAAAAELLALPEPPTAIFAYDDVLAAGVLRAARDAGVPVPEKLAVVGFDDSELAGHLDLTTVRQPLEDSGALAIRTLSGLLADPSASLQRTLLGLSVVERSTT